MIVLWCFRLSADDMLPIKPSEMPASRVCSQRNEALVNVVPVITLRLTESTAARLSSGLDDTFSVNSYAITHIASYCT